MITQTLSTLNGKITITIPTQLNELRLGQLIAMQAKSNMNDLEAIHILSDVPITALQQIRNFTDLNVFTEYVILLSRQIKYLYNSNVMPAYIKFSINGKLKKVKIPKNLSIEPAGAFMSARDIIADEISIHIKEHGETDWQQHFNPSLKACSQILAHYFYCPTTGLAYDEHHASMFTEQIELLPATEALPIAKYFFLNYPNLLKPKTGFWHRLLLYLNKKPASANLNDSNTSIQ